MIITINSRNYDDKKWIYVDSINYTDRKDCLYHQETLYITDTGEFIMCTEWRIDPEVYYDDIKNGKLSKRDLRAFEEYRIVPREEANEWIERAEWEV